MSIHTYTNCFNERDWYYGCRDCCDYIHGYGCTLEAGYESAYGKACYLKARTSGR